MVQTRFAMLVMSCCLASTGCLILEPVNVPPRLDFLATRESAMARGDSRTLKVTAQDEDLEALLYSWGERAGACPESLDMASPTQGPSARDDYEFRAKMLGVHCVWAMATDRWGARSHAFTTVVVANKMPVASVELPAIPRGSTVPLGSTVAVRMRGVDEDEEDEVEVEALIFAPDGRPVTATACESGLMCFRVTTSGTWIVSALATDSLGDSAEADEPTSFLVQEDLPPCLEAVPASSRLIQDPSQPLSLEVRATDDLDSVPSADSEPSQASFQWRVWDSATREWLRALDQIGRVFRVPAHAFRPADTLRIRVDVYDRVARPQLATICPTEMDECSARAACRQRITWTVDFR